MPNHNISESHDRKERRQQLRRLLGIKDDLGLDGETALADVSGGKSRRRGVGGSSRRSPKVTDAQLRAALKETYPDDTNMIVNVAATRELNIDLPNEVMGLYLGKTRASELELLSCRAFEGY
jgi:hypothetical protein